MNRVWIAEKPSAAKDLAEGLKLAFGGTPRYDNKSGVISVGDEAVVALAGHLLEVERPAAYLDPEKARIEQERRFGEYRRFLPILPSELKKTVRRDVKERFDQVARVLKKAKIIVNAGDIDREGQLIVDELLSYLGIDPYGPNVLRFGLASNLPEDIAREVKGKLDRNGDERWRLASQAAQVRQYLDWVWGMNFSIAGQAIARNPKVSAGRVQTPLLALVAERCHEIENFRPYNYFVPVVTLADGTTVRWSGRKDWEGSPGFDKEGRIIDERLAKAIVDRILAGEPGMVTAFDVKEHRQKPPLGYSLSVLQATASRMFGVTLEDAGAAIKSLYQDHKAISYIGTDCRYLPESMHAEAPRLFAALAKVAEKGVKGADASIKSPIFNDRKLDEHYAIVPTGRIPERATELERNVFKLVVNRFLSQFYPDYVYKTERLEVNFGTDLFVATRREDLAMGWREVETADEEGSKEKGKEAETEWERER